MIYDRSDTHRSIVYMTANPFKLISTEIKYQNPWISVREDKVVRPSGSEWVFGVVTMKDGTLILPVHGEDVYLNYEYHYALGKYEYKLFGWAIDPLESPIQAAQRELSEESGIEWADWEYIGFIHPYTQTIQGTDHMFLVRNLSFFSSHLEDGETATLKKFSYKQALEMVYNGEITHGASVVSILRAKDILWP